MSRLRMLLAGANVADAQWVSSRTPTQPQAAEVSLALVGDIMFARSVERRVREHHYSFDHLFSAVAPHLQNADIAFANLETPLTTRGEPIEKRFAFRSSPEAAHALAGAGLDVVSLANNHILDYGLVGLDDTLAALGGVGVRHGGIATSGGSQAPVLVEARGVRVGFLFYCDPIPPFANAREFLMYDKRPAEATATTLRRDIAALRPQVDVLVVSMHWGIEYKRRPSEHTQDLARFIIDLGADVIAGHHPHVQHGVERYRSGVILYSLGNFIFDQRPERRRVARIYRLLVTRGRVKEVLFLQAEIGGDDSVPRPVADGFIDFRDDCDELRSGRRF